MKVLSGKPEHIDYENIVIIENWHFSPFAMDNKPKKFGYYLFFSINTADGRPELQNINAEGMHNQPDEPEYFLQVDQMPQIIGGIEAIMKEIKYPEDARKQGLEGRVFIKAYIDETGKVAHKEIIRGIGGSCDKEALNALNKISFIPGKHNGKNVKTQVVIPILFKLK